MYIYVYVYIYIYIYTRAMRGVPLPAKNLLIAPLPTKFLFPPQQKSIQPNKKMKVSFLTVVIPVPFLF